MEMFLYRNKEYGKKKFLQIIIYNNYLNSENPISLSTIFSKSGIALLDSGFNSNFKEFISSMSQT